MKRQSRKDRSDLQRQHVALQVLEMYLAGNSAATIADRLSMEPRKVNDILSEVRKEITQRFTDMVDTHKSTVFLRLEQLYQTAQMFALGGYVPAIDPVTGAQTEVWMPPDRYWVKTAVDILKVEVQLIEAQLQMESEKKDELAQSGIAIETILTNDELYKEALAATTEVWNSNTWADLGADDYIQLAPGDEPAPVKRLNKRIKKQRAEQESGRESDDE